MKPIVTLLILAMFATESFAGELSLPTMKELWGVADVVVSSQYIDIEEHEHQRDLPKYLELKYTRVKIHFNVEEVLKGELEKGDDYIWTNFYTAEKIKNPTGKDDNMFGYEPYLKRKKSDELYLVFLRRDVFGRLKPVHDRYFLSITSRGYGI